MGEEVARWPLQGRDLKTEIFDIGGWLDVAVESVKALVPDVWPFN